MNIIGYILLLSIPLSDLLGVAADIIEEVFESIWISQTLLGLVK